MVRNSNKSQHATTVSRHYKKVIIEELGFLLCTYSYFIVDSYSKISYFIVDLYSKIIIFLLREKLI